MLTNLHQTITHSSVLKIISFILGFLFWFSLSRTYVVTTTYTVPVAVYGLPDGYKLDIPETVHVTLSGKRSDMRLLQAPNIAVHVDGSHLTVGQHNLEVSHTTLFLPEHINVLSYNPVPSIITVTQQEATKQPAAATTERSPHATT